MTTGTRRAASGCASPPPGARHSSCATTADGRERRKTIREWPTWTLEAARAEARDLARGIDKGDDPLEAKRRRREEPTVGELAKDWLDRYADGLASEVAIRGYINNDLLPALGHLKVSDLRRRDVIEVVEAKAEKTPRVAAQLLLYARRLLDYATDRDHIRANPLAGLKPSSITVKGKRDPIRAVVRGRNYQSPASLRHWLHFDRNMRMSEVKRAHQRASQRK